MAYEYRWGVVGCGGIAREMAENLARHDRRFTAAWNRTHETAAQFAKDFSVEKTYEDVDALFQDADVDAVYLATTHNIHYPHILAALKAGKHVLCEKAITLNSEQLADAKKLADENGLILAEAMTIYHMPLYQAIEDYLAAHPIGALREVDVWFGAKKEFDETDRFYSPALAGGALLDLGVYALSFARRFMTEAPSVVSSVADLAPTGVDRRAAILLKNEKKETASITMSFQSELPRVAVAAYDEGYVEVLDYTRPSTAKIVFCDDREPVTIEAGEYQSCLYYEIADMEKAMASADKNAWKDRMRAAYTDDVMRLMTDLRNDWGVRYPEERA